MRSRVRSSGVGPPGVTHVVIDLDDGSWLRLEAPSGSRLAERGLARIRSGTVDVDGREGPDGLRQLSLGWRVR